MIGVIGGMGPLATVDFMQKVIAATTAEHDEEHVPLLVSNDARIPRRPPAILNGNASPLPRLMEIRDRLIAAGAMALVMPCNTAHHWHADLARNCPVPFPSLIELASDAAAKRSSPGERIGVIATRATLFAGLFDQALKARGRSVLLPADPVMDTAILPSIAHVKAGRLAQAQALMQSAVQALLNQGANVVLLACTEAPIALAGAPDEIQVRCIDTTQVLALATVALWQAKRPTGAFDKALQSP
jgi:aspartate racemase